MAFGHQHAFLLWFGPLQDFLPLRWLADHGTPSVLALPRDYLDRAQEEVAPPYGRPPATSPAPRGNEAGFFVLPDRLRWYFWAAACLFATPQLGRAIWLSEAGGWQPSLLYGIGGLVLLLAVGPLFVYVALRRPVLFDLAIGLPPRFRSWLVPVPIAGGRAKSSFASCRIVLCWMLWPFARAREPVAFRGRSCRQAVLTRLAMYDLFGTTGGLSHQRSPVMRWVFYHVTPLWLSLSFMLVYLLAGPCEPWMLAWMTLVWLGLSCAFFAIESRYVPRDFNISSSDLNFFPSQISVRHLWLNQVIDYSHFRLLLNVTVATIAVLFIGLATLLCAP